MSKDRIGEALNLIFQGIGILQSEFSTRRFTIDGRLVGDIGEIIAAAEFDIVLDDVSRATHDAKTSDGRDVQIKATFKDHLAFRSTPQLYLGFKLFPNGAHDVVFNGPGKIIFDYFSHRRGIGIDLLSFRISTLRDLSASIAEADRVPRRIGLTDGGKHNRQNL